MGYASGYGQRCLNGCSGNCETYPTASISMELQVFYLMCSLLHAAMHWLSIPGSLSTHLFVERTLYRGMITALVKAPCALPIVDCMSLVPCNLDTVQWSCNTSLCEGFVQLHYIHTICQLAVTYLVILRQFEVLKHMNLSVPLASNFCWLICLLDLATATYHV